VSALFCLHFHCHWPPTCSVWPFLVTNLGKIRAPNGADQSKVEFSKRKPVFSARFLVVGVPFHRQYLRDATDKIVNDILHGEELWTPEGLHIPVYPVVSQCGDFIIIHHSSTSYQ
jgi:hypothetical protein